MTFNDYLVSIQEYLLILKWLLVQWLLTEQAFLIYSVFITKLYFYPIFE